MRDVLARLGRLEDAARAAEPVAYPPLYMPPLACDPGIASEMACAVQDNPAISDDELREMARRDVGLHPSSVEQAVVDARDTAAYWQQERERQAAANETG